MEQNKSRLRQLCEVLSAVFTLFAKTRPVAEEVSTAAVAEATAAAAAVTVATAATAAAANAATTAVTVVTEAATAATTFIDEKAQIELRIVQENLHTIEVPITTI